MRRHIIVACIAAGVVLGCAGLSPNDTTPAATDTVLPTVNATTTEGAAPSESSTPESPSPASSQTSSIAESQELDPCSPLLIRPAEASAILGEPVKAAQAVNGGCWFGILKDSQQVVSVAAAQDQQTQVILQGQMILLGFAGAHPSEEEMGKLKSLAEALAFRDFFGELVAAGQGTAAIKAQLISNGSDAGYWAWLSAAPTMRQGALMIARGNTLVNVNVVIDASKSEKRVYDASMAQAARMLGRLPGKFTIKLPSTPMPPTVNLTPIATSVPNATVTRVPRPGPSATPSPALGPNAPPAGFVKQPSYGGDCSQRPANSICLRFDDGYVWFLPSFDDNITGWTLDGTWQGKKIQIAVGMHADYQHILGSNLVRIVNK